MALLADDPLRRLRSEGEARVSLTSCRCIITTGSSSSLLDSPSLPSPRGDTGGKLLITMPNGPRMTNRPSGPPPRAMGPPPSRRRYLRSRRSSAPQQERPHIKFLQEERILASAPGKDRMVRDWHLSCVCRQQHEAQECYNK